MHSVSVWLTVMCESTSNAVYNSVMLLHCCGQSCQTSNSLYDCITLEWCMTVS